MEKTIKDDRRDFLLKSAKIAGVTFCGCILGSLLTACDKDEEIAAPPMPTGDFPTLKIAEYPVLANPGGFMMLKVRYKDGTVANSGNNVFVMRIDQNTFATLDTLCLHKSAGVSLVGGVLTCDLHAAKFDNTTGAVTDLGFAGESFPPLRVFQNEYDAAENELKIRI